LYFDVSITSRKLQTSRLGLVSAGEEANVGKWASRSRLELELLRLVPIPGCWWGA